jgi:TatD DNase family protein
MELVDTHAHLDVPEFEADLVEVLERAASVGVGRIVCVGTTLESSRACIQLARRYHGRIFAAVGVHPNYCAEAGEGDFEEIRALATLPEVVAVGETGLDFHHDFAPRELQLARLRDHVSLSLSVGKPLILHARKADEELISVLREQARLLHGVRHCFDAEPRAAGAYLELGLHVAFGGLVARPGYKRVKAAAEKMPSNRLLVETDCPYMAPSQVKTGRNEPAFIEHTVRALAGIRRSTPEEIAEVTTRNAASLFFAGR